MQLRKLLIARPDVAFIYGSPDELDALALAVRLHTDLECIFSIYGRETNPDRVELSDFFYKGEIDEANKVLKLAYAMGLNVIVEIR